MSAKILKFDRSVGWETTLCEQCNRGAVCQDNESPCLPLEMLRQLVLKSPGDQVAMLRNVAEHFDYPDGDAS